jgi:RNA recognition motif-containing protein
MYKQAEQAYVKVLEIETLDDPELDEELYKVRVAQLQEMGFSRAQSETTIKQHHTVQASLESLFIYNNTNSDSNNVTKSESCSDEENNELDYNGNDDGSDYGGMDEYNSSHNSNGLGKKLWSTNGSANNYSNKLKSITNGNMIIKKSIETSKNNGFNSSSSSSSEHHVNNENTKPGAFTMNSGPPSTSLWIGNVDPSVTEETLIEMFSSFGLLTNVRCLPEKYCAFVNFKNKEDAHKALQNLQVCK